MVYKVFPAAAFSAILFPMPLARLVFALYGGPLSYFFPDASHYNFLLIVYSGPHIFSYSDAKGQDL